MSSTWEGTLSGAPYRASSWPKLQISDCMGQKSMQLANTIAMDKL